MCKLIKNYDKEKSAWNEQYNQKNSRRKPYIPSDDFIGIDDEDIHNTCITLNIPVSNSRSGNIDSILNFMQQNNASNLSEIGILSSEEQQNHISFDEEQANSVEEIEINEETENDDKKKDPDYLPASQNDDDEDENYDYDTEEDENEELDYECFDKICYWTYETANLFQAALITLLHFSMGGQRKQVIEFMTTKSFKVKKDGSTWCKTGVEKTIRPQAKDGIFVPKYVAKLIDYYKTNVRSYLSPRENVISLWISKAGSALQADAFLRRIKMIMEMFTDEHDFDPPKQINPQDFRRLVPSIIFSQQIHPDNVSLMDFIDTYSLVVGTSPRVIMIYYNRAKANNKQINAVETLETQMLMSLEGLFIVDVLISHFI